MLSTYKNTFEPELLNELQNCPVVEIDPDNQILNDGAYIKVVPLVLSGSIKVVRYDSSGKEILIYNINPGESCILSITASITQNKSKAIAITEENTRAIMVSAELISKWMDTYRTWRNFVMNLYYDRLNSLIIGLEDLAFKNIDQRLLHRLHSKKRDADNWIHITHQELADELGSVREVISRLLKKLEKQGIVELSRGKIKILS